MSNDRLFSSSHFRSDLQYSTGFGEQMEFQFAMKSDSVPILNQLDLSLSTYKLGKEGTSVYIPDTTEKIIK